LDTKLENDHIIVIKVLVLVIGKFSLKALPCPQGRAGRKKLYE